MVKARNYIVQLRNIFEHVKANEVMFLAGYSRELVHLRAHFFNSELKEKKMWGSRLQHEVTTQQRLKETKSKPQD